MAEQIQELINKIKQEGVEAAQKKAKDIEQEAQKKADKIIKDAQEQAKAVTDKAESDAKKTKESTEKALKQASRDMLLNLRKDIQSLLQRIVKEDVAGALNSEKLADIIQTAVGQCLEKKETEKGLTVSLNKEQAGKISKSFISKLQKEIKGELEFQPTEEISAGFVVSFDEGKSSFEFTDESLAEYLSTYLNQEIARLLKDAGSS